MGSVQSTRKITLIEDEKAGVIKLSESLAHRLRGQMEGHYAKSAERTSPAAVQEPLPPSPPPPSEAPLPPPEAPLPPPEVPLSPPEVPLPPPPKPSYTEVPLLPEPPRVPEVVPIPIPEPVHPEPPAPKTIEPEPQPPGESHPLGSVDVDPSPLIVSEAHSDETSVSDLSLSNETNENDPVAIVSKISESKETAEMEVSELENPASATKLFASSEGDVPPAVPTKEETSLLADAEAAAVTGNIVEVQLPSHEALLAAAFASEPLESQLVEPSPPVVEEPKSLPPLPFAHQVEEAPDVPAAPAAPDVNIAIKASPGPTLSQPSGSIPPWSIYAEEAHLMVMRLREEKEQEIKKLNLEWRDKMDAREKEFSKMANLSEEQVGAALKEVENLFMKASCTPVCQNHQEAVMNCYQDHPRQSLRCAREVEQFTQCVDLSRLQSIMKQEAH